MTQISATELRAGSAFFYEGKPFKVVKYSLIKMGRGGATVRVNCKNLENGSNIEHAFSSNLTFEEVNLSKRKLQYLYKDSVSITLMDPASYEQVEIPLSIVGGDIYYIKEGDNVDVLYWEDRPLSIDLPPNVVLTVTECDPGLKGNSATNVYKPAKMENGLTIKVPLFIKQGEKIRVDTRTGEYTERAK